MADIEKHGAHIAFGPFRLSPRERLLVRDGSPVTIGGRAFDLLVVLTERPGQVLSKRELLRRVWPDVVVEDGSLRFHMAGLRKALGDGRNGARYIATQVGVGYAFVAPIERSAPGADAQAPSTSPAIVDAIERGGATDAADPAPPSSDPAGRALDMTPIAGSGDGDAIHRKMAADFSHTNLPNTPIRMVGRDDIIQTLSAQLSEARFVTIVGAGGVGKTTVAVAVGHHLVEAFDGAVHFVDLGAVSNPDLVAATAASTLGLSVQSHDPAAGLIAYLARKRILLILDTCEHVIEAAARLASRIFAAAPQAHILATSREPLRVEGEQVHKLASLACPPGDPRLTATDVQTFPAAQLFLERAAASGATFDLKDADAPIVANICRKLDGVPLAIELAAGRVEGYGLQQTAALLDQRLTLLWPGKRTAPARQKTLQATLDWSFELLSDSERIVLRRLAVFVGDFAIDAALQVVACPSIDRTHIFRAIDGLIAKSMVAVRPAGAMMRYRLLDTTRAYALQTSITDAELAGLSAQHAAYYLKWLDDAGTDWPSLSSAAQRALHLAGLANVRAALEWAFGPQGDTRTGIRFAAAAAPVFLAMSLLTECLRWSEHAISLLDETTRGSLEEMHLQAAVGVSLMFTRGGRDAARTALEKSLEIAERRGNALDQARLLGPLNMFHRRTGHFTTALQYAQRFSATVGTVGDSAATALAHSIMGISLHLGGDLAGAQVELEAALAGGPSAQRTSTIHLGFDGGVLARSILARNLWLQGFPDEALALSRRAVEEASTMDHALTLSIALIWAISISLWNGDVERAETHIDMLTFHAESHSLGPFLLVALGFKGDAAIQRHDAAYGVETMQSALRNLHEAPYELLTTAFNLSLARGLSAVGRVDEARSLIDTSLDWVRARGNRLYLPELLRMKGRLLHLSDPDRGEARTSLLRSLALSRRQGARAWELRTATDLAALLAESGERENARKLLQPVLERFTEGHATADVQAATRQLASLA